MNLITHLLLIVCSFSSVGHQQIFQEGKEEEELGLILSISADWQLSTNRLASFSGKHRLLGCVLVTTLIKVPQLQLKYLLPKKLN